MAKYADVSQYFESSQNLLDALEMIINKVENKIKTLTSAKENTYISQA